MIIDGPYGIFTNYFGIAPDVLCIAGGIGITPIRPLMEELLQNGKHVQLLYANRTMDDIVFKDELDVLAKRKGAGITHILSNDPSFAGERGYIDAQKLQRLVPDVALTEIFLCGPPVMMDAVRGVLSQLGVPTSRIHFERFSL